MTEPEAPKGKHAYDHIETYLKEPLLTQEAINAAGGYLNLWEVARQTSPCVAQMALDFISAPGILNYSSVFIFLIPFAASSVDAERAFSTGRRQVNFMQHNMSSETFQARMAVGSWAKTPLYPGFSAISRIIADKRNSD